MTTTWNRLYYSIRGNGPSFVPPYLSLPYHNNNISELWLQECRMPSKARGYYPGFRFPPNRIKKMMQKDDEVRSTAH